jgi:Fe-S cluster assembly protein SufD
MNASWEEFETRFEQRLNSLPQNWFKTWTAAEFARFQTLGLPQTKHEWWRSTPLANLYRQAYTFSDTTSPIENISCSFPRDAYVIHLKGSAVHVDAMDFPPGVIVMPLLDAIKLHGDLVKQTLGQALSSRDGFTALNSALFSNGVWIYVPQGIQLEKPILIHHVSQAEHMDFSRHLICLESGASARILEYFDSDDKAPGFLHHISELILQENAYCHHFKIQQFASSIHAQTQVWVKQHQSSQFNSFLMQLGGAMSTCDVGIDLIEEHASANLTGLFLPKGKQFHQQRLQVNHHVPHCHSTQNFRGILNDAAQGVFIGQVKVDKYAQKTQAHQSNKNLVLSKTAHMITCPQLEIDADDVVCSHGATVGQLDEDAVFYLRSRGFSESEALHMLVNAFVMSHFDSIPDEALRAWFMEKMSNH